MSESVGYEIELTNAASKSLDAMSSQNRKRVLERMDRLKVDPRGSANCERLKGPVELWRIRCGDYRVVYEIHESRLIVHVVKIDQRREVNENARGLN